jgi:hypothetical protein
MNTPTNHRAPAHTEDKHSGMKLQQALTHKSKRDSVMNHTLRSPPSHQHHNAESSRNRSSLKVFRLSGCILGKRLDGNVEARQTRKSAENEEGEQYRVEEGTESERKGARGGGHAEGNLR